MQSGSFYQEHTAQRMYRHHHTTRESGQALVEVAVAFAVIGLFMFGAHHLWRHSEARQAAVEAVRFAAWERVVWEPSDNTVEKHALHKSDDALATDVVRHQLSTPAAMRAYRATLSAYGTPAPLGAYEKWSQLTVALKTFFAPDKDPTEMVTVNTLSSWTNDEERMIRGRDPTLNTTTSLELDRDTYRTVSLTFGNTKANTQTTGFFKFGPNQFHIEKKLSLITNTWAASPPLIRVRTVRQLLPFSSGDEISGTKPNVLAYFGMENSTGSASAADFIGMVPWWNFIGGPHGMAGQYVTRQVGLSGNGANALLQSAGKDFKFDAANPAGSLLLQAQLDQKEYIDFNYARTMNHRHVIVVDKTAEQQIEDEGGAKSRNGNSGKRKYRAFSLKNPVENYFAE